MKNPISQSKQLSEDGTTIQMTAVNIQRERTGVHARVGLGLNDVEFKWSWMNVERDEDRVRLVNAAYKLMLADRADITTLYPAKFMALDFDRFCASLWAKYIATEVATPLPGSALDKLQEFLLRPFIPEDSGVIIFAPPGRGKSYGAMLIGVSIDAGVNELWEVKQSKVLFVNLERSKDSIARRLGSVNMSLGLDPDRALLTMNARGRRLKDLVDPIRESVLLHQVKLVIVDSLSRVGYGDMNANDAANAAMDDLNSVCESWMILAHTPRDDETHVFGSQMYDAAADVVVRLQSERRDNRLGIGFEVTKANDMGRVPMTAVGLEFDSFGLQHVTKATEKEYPLLFASRKADTSSEVEDYLQENTKASATDIADALHIDRRIVKGLLDSDLYTKLPKNGKEQLYARRQPNYLPQEP